MVKRAYLLKYALITSVVLLIGIFTIPNLAYAVHSSGPTIVDTDPEQNTIGVPNNKTIIFTFNENLVQGNNWNNIRIDTEESFGKPKGDQSIGEDIIRINDNTIQISQLNYWIENKKYYITIPSGAVRDASGNDFTSEYILIFTTGKKFEETEARYTGTWTSANSSLCSDGAIKYSTVAGDTASYTFNGTGIAWYGMKGKNRGIARVYIDDVLQGTYDQYYSAYTYQNKIFEKAGLSSGAHTIKVEVTGAKHASSTGYITDIDYFIVATGGSSTDTQAPTTPSNLTATATSENRIDLNWAPSTDNVGITGYNIERSSNGSSSWTEIGTSTTTTFTDLAVAAGNTYYYRVNARDAAGNISATSNTANATIPPSVSGTKAEETEATYVGTWTTANSSSCSGGAIKYSTVAGDITSYTFSGTGIAWYGMKGKNRGIAKVYLDDVLQGTYDQYYSAYTYQNKIFEKTGLDSGSHTIRIEVTGAKNENSSGYITDIDYYMVNN